MIYDLIVPPFYWYCWIGLAVAIYRACSEWRAPFEAYERFGRPYATPATEPLFVVATVLAVIVAGIGTAAIWPKVVYREVRFRYSLWRVTRDLKKMNGWDLKKIEVIRGATDDEEPDEFVTPFGTIARRTKPRATPEETEDG